jgi:glycerophosphoryl diester phosphodiesterase
VTVVGIAHRAGNSLAGLREAGRSTADVVECDVHDNRGRLEVRHLATAGPLPFVRDLWEHASRSAPRLGLEEVLEADRRASRFMLDLKGTTVETGRSVADLLHRTGHQDEVWVCGRYWPSVERVAELPWVRPVLSARTRLGRRALEQRMCRRSGPAPYGVSVHVSLLDRSFVQRLRERVEVVMTWPVNTVATLERVVALGANGIITDEPAILRAVRGAVSNRG